MPKGAIPSQGKRVTRVLPKKIGVERRPPALPGGGRLGQISQHYRDQGWRPTFTPSVMPEYPDPGVEKSLQKDIHLKKRPTTEDFLAGWDWQTAERGPNGEALPKGALSWSPRGEPFFGQGLPGWWKEFVWKINKDSIGDPDKIWEPIKGDIPKIEGGLEKAAQFGLTALQAGSRLYQQAAQGEEGEKPTIPQKVVRTVGGLVGGALSLLGEAGQKAEQSFLGGGIGRREAGAGSALPAVDVGPEWLDYVLNALPPVGIYNSIRVLTSPKTMAEKLDIIEENIQAGRIAYSAALDPMLREEYIRMYREGYAPSVIEWELENPLAEMVGELINDPLNVLGGWMGKATKATKALREAELFYDVAPEIAKALGAADEITEGSKAVGRLQELAEAVGTAMQRTKAGLTKYAQDASFAATTATGKRHITIKQIGQFSAWVMANHKKDPDQAYDLLQALAKLAGDNLDERVDALTTIKNSMAPRMFLSEVGNRTGIVMRQIIGVGDDGKLASGKNFLDEVRKIEKIEDAIAFAEKRMGRVIDDMFPTVAERVAKAKKGEAVMVGGVNMAQPSAAARAVSAFDAVMQKNLYRPLNTFFAGVYMGLSPAYAMRNAMNNNLTMLVDYGLGIFLGKRGIKRADSWLDSASKWLGYVPKVEGFTPGAAVETAALWRRLPFQKLSEVWERKAAERITGYVVEKTMLRALKPGRALPHVDDLLKAGLSEGAARQFVKLIVENFGDVKAARQQLMAASRLGNMSVLDSAAWLADKDADLLRSLNAHDDLIDLVREGRKAGKSLDDALADVRRVRQEVLKKAKQTESEVATIADDAVGFDDVATMAEHGVDDGLKAVASNKFQANNNAVDAYEQAVRVLAGYFESDPEISPLLVRFFTNHGNLWQKAHRQGQEFAQLWGGKHYTRWVAEFGRERKLDYAAIWNQLPWDNATKGAIPKEWGEFRKRFWEEWYYPTQDAFYREAREAYVKGADELIDALPVDRIPADNQGAVLERVADARRNRDLARMYDDTLPPGILRLRIEDAKAHKDNVFAAQLYGKQYGIDPPQYNHVLNTINKQLRLDGKAEYEHLYDIPPEVAEQAFANRIVRQAEEAAAKRADDIQVLTNPDEHLERLERLGFGPNDTITKPKALSFLEGIMPGTKVTYGNIGDADSISGKIPTGLIVEKGKVRLGVQVSETSSGILVRWIESNKPGSGLGTEFMEALRQYANLKKSDITIYQVTNPDFYRRFDWLVDAGTQEFKYSPKAAAAAQEAAPVAADILRPVAYSGGTPQTEGRIIEQGMSGVNQLFDRVEQQLRDAWGKVDDVTHGNQLETALEAYEKTAVGRIAEARLMASRVAEEGRKFTLLSYPEKRNFDLALAYIYPYHFWYNRSYFNWMKRLAYQPQVAAAYAKYKDALAGIHAGAPEWWKYNINTNELLGMDSENPLFFNLEATLNPLNGITGVDFDDPQRRKGWFASLLDDMQKFGPSLWTPISLATAIALKSKGEDEAAARWAGRMVPQTATLKSLLNLTHIAGAAEIDPFVHYFSGGLDPYERRRVHRALSWMVDMDEVAEADAIDAAYSQSGPIWEAAKERAVNQRALGQLSSFALGVGFKARNLSDLEIDRFYQDYYRLNRMLGDLSPEEVRNSYDVLRNQYPFMDTLLLSRKGDELRDRSFAYAVIGRIPPGQTDDLAKLVGISGDMIRKFYDDKGHIETWDKADRMRFMAGVLSISAVLDLPDRSTRQEWNEARTAYNQMRDMVKQEFGDDIWDKVDAYYAFKDDRDRADVYLAAHPDVEDAMNMQAELTVRTPILGQYYGSFDKIERYYKGLMYSQIEKQLGEDIFDKWDEYFALQLEGKGKEYYAAHPELKRYGELKDIYEQYIAQAIIRTANVLKEPTFPALRDTGVTAGLGEGAIRQALGQDFPTYYDYEWEDWQEYMSPPLQRLVQDHAWMGKPLSYQAQQQLERIANSLDIDDYLLVQLITNSLRQPVVQY